MRPFITRLTIVFLFVVALNFGLHVRGQGPVSGTAATTLAPAPAQPAPKILETDPKFSIVDVRFLTDRWLCVVMDITAEVLAHRDGKALPELQAAREKWRKDPGNWQYAIHKRCRTMQSLAEVRATWIKQIENADFWKVNGKAPLQVTYWPQAVDGFPAYEAGFPGMPEYADLARIADFVYVQLPEPIQPGQNITITANDGRTAKVGYEPHATVCWALKVNQVGYHSQAPAKYAYLGMWLGAAGPADFAAFQGKPFGIYSYQGGSTWREGQAVGPCLHTGTIRLRKKSSDQKHQGILTTGEDVYELDFSSFNKPGTYCIVVPGLGRSWPFRIGDEVYGEAFFTMMRGLFHQRCGCALQPQFTAWSRDACHTVTYQGGFPPEGQRWYGNAKFDSPGPNGKTRYGFRDETGKPVSLNSFTAVQATATKKEVPGLAGGWHDAADYDRRIHHYHCVWDLCGIYELFPKKFSDGQLHLPESGNGIPDILDEAAIQVDLFRKTQTPAGGVVGWIEQNRHPRHDRLEERADKDQNPFYVSLPDRTSSFAYAAAAAYLGRLLQPFDPGRAKTYLESARRAYDWAKQTQNRLQNIRFTIPKGAGYDNALIGKTLTFDEPETIPGIYGMKVNPWVVLAAAQFHVATGEKSFLEDWRKWQGEQILPQGLPSAITPFAFVTPVLRSDLFGKQTAERLTGAIVELADQFCQGQDESAYRHLWYSTSHRFFMHMSWGNVHAVKQAVWPLLAWRFTGADKYRSAVFLAADWELGCNALGKAHATGLGSTHPVFLQHIQSQMDGVLEPVPGIVPYTYTYGVPIAALNYQFGLLDGGHPSVKNFFSEVALCALPKTLGRDKVQEQIRGVDRKSNWMLESGRKIRAALEPSFPIFRRHFIHPYLDPGQNEFTVSETISNHAAIYAALLPETWMPADSLKNRQPRRKAEELPIYLQP